MEIKKTVGLPYKDGERKAYCIYTTCGQEFVCTPRGSQGYDCEGMSFGSIKAIKAHVLAGGFQQDDESEPDEVSTLDGADTWDCVHPCALLVYNWMEYDLGLGEREMDTLNKYGWLDVMGRPDVARAEREIKRVNNLRKDN